MSVLPRFTEEELRNPDRRGEVEAYVQLLQEACWDDEAEYWQARLAGDEERAAHALQRVESLQGSDPAYWQDPEVREFLPTYIQALHPCDPVRAAWYQAKLDGDETVAQRIMVQSEVFALQRVLNQTPKSDSLGRRLVESWKKSLVEQASK